MKELQREFDFKTFVLFCFPIMLQVLLRNVVGLSDNFMVGVLGPDYMAALKIATSYFFFFIILLFAFSNASGIIASQLWGKKDKEEFYRVCGTNIFLATILSVVLSLVMFFGSTSLSSLMIKDQIVVAYSSQYLRIIAICFIFSGFNIALSVVYISQGDTKIPFYQQVITTIINIILNYALIFGKFGFPKMGVAGAAWASVISTAAGTIYMVYEAYRSGRMPSLHSIVKPLSKNIKEILHIGVPVLADLFMWQFAMMTYLKFIGLAGTTAMAVYGVVGLFFSILFLAVSGFVNGTGIIVGQLLGAGYYEDAKKFGKKALGYSMIVGAAAGLLLAAFSGAIPGVFKLTGDAYMQCLICLIILGFRQVFATVNGVLPSVIRAGKDTVFVLCTTLIGFFIFGLPLSFIAGPYLKLGIIAIFSAMTVEECAKSVLFYIRFRSGKWIKMNKKDVPILKADNEELIKAKLLPEE